MDLYIAVGFLAKLASSPYNLLDFLFLLKSGWSGSQPEVIQRVSYEEEREGLHVCEILLLGPSGSLQLRPFSESVGSLTIIC